MNRAHNPLSIKVIDGEITISIGCSILAYALQSGTEGWTGSITDDLGFAKDVVAELEDEDELGVTPVHRLLEVAALRAAEQGSMYVAESDQPPFQPS